MFRKPNRNLRVRRVSSEEEEEEPGPVERVKRAGGRGLTCETKKWKEEAADSSSSDEEQPGNGDPLPRAAGPASALSFSEEREGDEVAFKVRKPTVNAVVFKVQRKTQNADCAEEPDEKGSGEAGSPESEPSEDEVAEHLKKEDSPRPESNSSPSLSPASSAGEIPDAKQIRAARRQRKLARAQGDYISLDTNHQGSDSSQSESDSELDDHEMRIKFAPGVKTIKERMAEEMSSSSDSEDSLRDDESQDRWEEQQIRKGLKHQQGVTEDLLRRHSPLREKKPTEPKFPALLVTVDDIKKKLSARIASIQELHRSHVMEREKHEHDLESSKNSLQMLEKSSGGQSYKYFKEMKIFVENFVDCISEKIEKIKALDSEMFQIMVDRTKALVQRRQEDLRNEAAAVQKLVSGNGKPCDTETAEEEIKKQMQDAEERRKKRKQKREDSGQTDHYEGMSSDDEMPPDQQTDYRLCREDIVLQSKSIFEDVHEDFFQIRNILSKFHTWRSLYPESYYDAYINLCIHKLLGPLVQMQLIGWNPLEDSADLDQMPWYCDLEDFCYNREEDENNLEDNPDHKVMTSVIEKTVIPKVIGYVEHLWDPLSSEQTDRLVHFCKTHVLGSDSSKAVQGLVSCLVSRLKKSIEEDVYIPVYPKRLLEDRNSPHSRFQDRRFWSAVKLLRNVLCWDGFLEEETLQELSLDKLLNRYLMLILLNAEPGSDLVNRCHKITGSLPQSWFKGLDNGSSLSRLANFSKHLLQTIHSLHKLGDRKNMAVLVSLLMKIKAQDYAQEVMAQYSMEGDAV